MKKSNNPPAGNQGSAGQNVPVSLVYENLTHFPAILNSLNRVIGLANIVADHYEQLNIGSFNVDVYKQMSTIGTSNVREQCMSVALDDISRLNINSPAMKELITSKITSGLEPLAKALEDLKKYVSGSYGIGYHSLYGPEPIVSFINGRFSVDDSNIQYLKDKYCRTYVKSLEQANTLQSLKQLVESYNTLIQNVAKVNPHTAKIIGESTNYLSDYILLKDGLAKIWEPGLEVLLSTPEEPELA